MLLLAEPLEIFGDDAQFIRLDRQRAPAEKAGAAADLRIGEMLEDDLVARRRDGGND